MGKKITYLLGAGASANALPVVGQMNERIAAMQQILIYIRGTNKPEQFREKIEEIIRDFKWMYSLSSRYYSLDTLAKKFYLSDERSNYYRLKKTLILYFLIEQLFEFDKIGVFKNFIGNGFSKPGALDLRYTNFIATIAELGSNRDISISEHIKIVTWNYDVQIELTLKQFTSETIVDVKKNFKIYSDFNFSNDFSPFLLKLNGNAIIYNQTEHGQISLFDYAPQSENPQELYELRINHLMSFLSTVEFNNEESFRHLNFSWEQEAEFDWVNNKQDRVLKEKLIHIAEQTDVLVIIGYSFPPFNRKMDNVLFQNLKKLSKVYIQDKEPEMIRSTVINAFPVFNLLSGKYYNLIAENKIEIKFQDVPNLSQFVIPHEYFID